MNLIIVTIDHVLYYTEYAQDYLAIESVDREH